MVVTSPEERRQRDMLFLKGAASTPWMSPSAPFPTPGSPAALGANGTCGDGGN